MDLKRFLRLLLACALVAGLGVSPAMASQDEWVEFVYQHNRSVERPALVEDENLVYQIDPEVRALSDQIVGSETNTRKQLKLIHDWICENIYYNVDYFEGRTSVVEIEPSAVLKTKRTVCDGFARLFQDLANAQDIPCLYVSGSALGAGSEGVWTGETVNGSLAISHAWNEARVDGDWIIVDTTWDCGNKYVNGASQKGSLKSQYFDCTMEELSKNHRTAAYYSPLYNMYLKGENGNAYFDDRGRLKEADKTITSIRVPEGVTEILYHAFFECQKLSSIELPPRLTKIESSTFYHCVSLEAITLPKGLETIESGAFESCTALRSIVLPEGLKTIEYGAFEHCTSLAYVYIPDSATEIDANAFSSDVPWYRNHENQIVYRDPAVPSESGEEPADQAADLPGRDLARESASLVYVDGREVSFNVFQLLDGDGNATNYVKLRDVAYVLNGTPAQFDLTWNGGRNAIELTRGSAYSAPTGEEMSKVFDGDQPYVDSGSSVLADAAAIDLAGITLTDAEGGGHNYYKLRDLGRALDFNVSWDPALGAVVIRTGEPYSDAD